MNRPLPTPLFAALALGLALASRTAAADDLPLPAAFPPSSEKQEPPSANAFAFGVRVGYSLPFPKGTLIGTGETNTLSNMYTGMVPLRLDVGYKFDRRVYVGGYFQYGIGLPATGQEPLHTICINGYVECSTADLQVGVSAAYYFLPRRMFDPWISLSFGYEQAFVHGVVLTNSGGLEFKGIDFITVDVGLDVRLKEALNAAPFVGIGVGEFGSCSAGGDLAAFTTKLCPSGPKGLHEWTTVGLRWMFDVGL